VSTTLSRDDVLAIARLAHLTLTDDDVELFGRQLAAILEWVHDVRQADTSGIPPTSHPLAMPTVWRDDERQPSLDRREVLEQAPDANLTDGLFRVPKVL
jgi:aspartyl-tRNA(Asn)/glutamyl-tRNA(Gln) amidotransferase subunit C